MDSIGKSVSNFMLLCNFFSHEIHNFYGEFIEDTVNLRVSFKKKTIWIK